MMAAEDQLPPAMMAILVVAFVAALGIAIVAGAYIAADIIDAIVD